MAQKGLYELSLGNNNAEAINWNANTNTLCCVTMCLILIGFYEQYPRPYNCFHPPLEPDPDAWPLDTIYKPNEFKMWCNVKHDAIFAYQY